MSNYGLSLVFFLLASLNNLIAQNLVENGGFELGDCPAARNDNDVVCESWYTISTADYFTECSNGEVRPLDNFMGVQPPFSGKAYAGLFSGHGIKDHISEILYTELKKPLEQGKRYKISFRYSLAENAGLISVSLGCALSNELAFKEVDTPFGIGHSPLFELEYSLIENDIASLSDDKSWGLFEKEFKAKGGEKFIYISGVPYDDISCIKRKEAPSVMTYADYAYYFIDEVSIVKQNKDGSYLTEVTQLETKEANGDRFSNIYFETNSCQLNDSSELSLDTLVKVLRENPSWRVTIQGHTDAIGNEKDNLILSESRANAVIEYLLSEGVEPERIKIEAMGSSTPLASNASEEERAKNRRVEISLVKN